MDKMKVSENEVRIGIILLAIFFSLIIGIGIFYDPYLHYVPDDGDADFWEDRRLQLITYDGIAVSTSIDDQLRIPRIRDPCVSPYELACGKWRGNGSYLHDNAMILHAKRLHRAVSHASSSHPWVSAAYHQCMKQMVSPYDSASIGVIERVLSEMEHRVTSKDVATANVQRLQALAEKAMFPIFLWQNNSEPFFEPSLWLNPWHPMLTKLACSISVENGDTNECIVAIETFLATTHHFAKTNSLSTYSLAQWKTSTKGSLFIEAERIKVWSDPNFQLLIRAMSIRSAAIFIRAAAAADMLLYTGLPNHHLQYGSVQFGADAAARHLLSTLEKSHPPSLYGWGAVGSLFFLAEEENDDGMHPSSTDSCLLALSDVLPHAVAGLIQPEANTTITIINLYKNLQGTFLKKIDRTTMFKRPFIDIMTQRVQTMELWMDDVNVNETNSLVEETFVGTAMNARRFNWLRASNGSVRGDVGNYNFHAETLNAEYLFDANAIYLPVGLTLPPFLPRKSETIDVELLYARLGVIIAHEMAHLFNRFLLQKARLASGEEFRLLSNMLKCFGNAIERFDERETFPDMLGFEIAYQACQTAGGCATGESRNRFFLLYAQTMCSNRPHAVYEVHQTAQERVNAASLMAFDTNGRGFAALQWSCFDPPTCSF